MTWQSAKSVADQHVEHMLERLRSSGADSCLLAEYEDAASYQFLKPGEEWSFEFHNMVIRACERKLRKHGIKVKIVTLNMVGYFDWLAKSNLPNKTENRARFILEAQS